MLKKHFRLNVISKSAAAGRKVSIQRKYRHNVRTRICKLDVFNEIKMYFTKHAKTWLSTVNVVPILHML